MRLDSNTEACLPAAVADVGGLLQADRQALQTLTWPKYQPSTSLCSCGMRVSNTNTTTTTTINNNNNNNMNSSKDNINTHHKVNNNINNDNHNEPNHNCNNNQAGITTISTTGQSVHSVNLMLYLKKQKSFLEHQCCKLNV